MKKIVLITMMILGLVGCGNICPEKPPKYAKYIEGGGHGMAYHFEIYEPQGDAGHVPSPQCINYTYNKHDIYTDDMGTLNGDSVLWFNVGIEDAYFNSIKKSATFTISKQKIIITGLYNGNEFLNGTYPIQ